MYTVPVLPSGDKRWLMFDGKSWVKLDFSQLPEGYRGMNDREIFHLKFKTNQSDGLLWYIGNSTNYVQISIKVSLRHWKAFYDVTWFLVLDGLQHFTPALMDWCLLSYPRYKLCMIMFKCLHHAWYGPCLSCFLLH